MREASAHENTHQVWRPLWLGRQGTLLYPTMQGDSITRCPTPDQILEEARSHWADHCAYCHANDGSGDTEVGHNLYPPTPDMRLPTTQAMSDGELYYTIENGIRLSGMPAWGNGSWNDEHSWKLVYFIRHLPEMTSQEVEQMKKLNPKSPMEMMEEEQEEQFLNGETAEGTSRRNNNANQTTGTEKPK